jgi:hypothetical protein
MELNAKNTGYLFLALITLLSCTRVSAAQPDSAYWKVVSGRAEKIVRSMDLEDPEKEQKVQDMIAWQYVHLSEIHDARDKELDEINLREDLEPAEKEKANARIKARSEKKIKKLHRSYLNELSSELDPGEVDMVKDGMTYGVLGHTYQGYLNLLPDLTEEQKAVIMEYLVEAREIAMDAGSSKEKHYWFGKYKGKINNYLSAEGYDLKKAEQNSQ